MQAYYANLDNVIKDARACWRPPPKLTLSEWADLEFRLSAESSAQTGRWKTIPYQKGIMDAFTDRSVTTVTVMKSARVGWTKILNALVGFFIAQDPCPIMVVQPTVEDSKGYSKEEIAPMLRDVPVLQAIIYEDSEETGPKDSGNTILHKRFPGGVLSMVGANSGTGFRRVSRRVVLFDEVDGYPPSAGSDGDPVKLGTKRSEYYHDRKIGHGSTPLIAGSSRIEDLFKQGDQRRYYVPCPHCDHFDYLVFTERETGGHWLSFDKEDTSGAHFVCSLNGCVIEHKHKRDMVARGEWRAGTDDKTGLPIEFKGHASFHIWAAYSFSPNATWTAIANEFLESRKDRDKLKTFVNTVLGETWQEAGEVPDYERLFTQRERYDIGTIPDGVLFLTEGVDVQKDRLIYEVVGWSGREKETWSIDIGMIAGDTAKEEVWKELTTHLARTYYRPDQTQLMVRKLCVDSGFNTQHVYNWVRVQDPSRVAAIKGLATDKASTLLTSSTAVDVFQNGKRFARGIQLWPIGSSVAKGELYGWLRLLPADVSKGEEFPPGFCHFPQYDKEYFMQLTAEHEVVSKDKKGYEKREWQKIPGRENHYLDCRIYARAAAAMLQVDRLPARARTVTVAATVKAIQDKRTEINGGGTSAQKPTVAQAPPVVSKPIPQRSDSRFLSRPGSGKPWMSKDR